MEAQLREMFFRFKKKNGLFQTKDSLSKCRCTFRLETLNPTSAGVIPIRLKKVTMEDISSASA